MNFEVYYCIIIKKNSIEWSIFGNAFMFESSIIIRSIHVLNHGRNGIYTPPPISLSLSLYIYIYIYIYCKHILLYMTDKDLVSNFFVSLFLLANETVDETWLGIVRNLECYILRTCTSDYRWSLSRRDLQDWRIEIIISMWVRPLQRWVVFGFLVWFLCLMSY